MYICKRAYITICYDSRDWAGKLDAEVSASLTGFPEMEADLGSSGRSGNNLLLMAGTQDRSEAPCHTTVPAGAATPGLPVPTRQAHHEPGCHAGLSRDGGRQRPARQPCVLRSSFRNMTDNEAFLPSHVCRRDWKDSVSDHHDPHLYTSVLVPHHTRCKGESSG